MDERVAARNGWRAQTKARKAGVRDDTEGHGKARSKNAMRSASTISAGAPVNELVDVEDAVAVVVHRAEDAANRESRTDRMISLRNRTANMDGGNAGAHPE
jgi:hypothetical protein